MKRFFLPLLSLAMFVLPAAAQAEQDNINLVGVQGYDLVSYHKGDGTPEKGTGNQVAYHNGVSYLFANKANRKAFEKNPEKYVPAYGGYCAFGVAKGKKFVGDPLSYKVVDGTLYLNLDKKVQNIWLKDVPGNIVDANENWTDIEAVHPADL